MLTAALVLPFLRHYLDPITIAVLAANFVVAVGLWRMKNWARIGVIVVDSINLLRTVVSATTGGYKGATVAGLAAPVFSVVLSLYVIYWFATHRKLFA
jgi:hypothetical protein